MEKGLLVVDFDGVSAYSQNLKVKANSIKNNLSMPSLSVAVFGLLSNYQIDYTNHVKKLNVFADDLSTKLNSYNENLLTIEGYVKNVESSSRSTTPSHENNDGNYSGEGPIMLPGNLLATSGFTHLPVNASLEEVNQRINELLKILGLTVTDLYSGKFNELLQQILSFAPSSVTYLEVLTQLEELLIQKHLNDMTKSPAKPKPFLPIEAFLIYLAYNKNIDYEKMLIDEQYAKMIKESLILHKESLKGLYDLSLKDAVIAQKELFNIINSPDLSSIKVDNITLDILKGYLNDVAKRNDISLEAMLTKEEYAPLAKKSLEEFLKFWLYGEEGNIPISDVVKKIEEIALSNNSSVEEILKGLNTGALTELANNIDNNSFGEIINNMDGKNIQNFIEEIVINNQHPEVKENPVIKEIVNSIVRNKDYILNKGPKTISPIKMEDISSIEPLPQETNWEEIVDEDLKTILTDPQYSDKLKEVISEDSNFNWSGLIPLGAGLGLIPLIVALSKKDKTKKDYKPSTENSKRGLINESFTYFADSNIVTEESLLDGTNFELLTIYLSQLDSLTAILNVLSIMKDEILQKYFLELYNQKYEHIWGIGSINLKIIFNNLEQKAKKQGLDLNTFLNNSNYEVWVKTAIVELLKLYEKYDQDISIKGGLTYYLNDLFINSNNSKNISLLKEYLEVYSKSLDIDTNSYLNQLTDNISKNKIFAIINFGDGFKGFSFGILEEINILLNKNKKIENIESNIVDSRVIESSGLTLLLFNSTDDQIEKSILNIIDKYSISKEDFYNNKDNYFNQIVNTAPNLNVVLFLLTNLTPKNLRKYLLNEINKTDNSKFILVVLKYLEYLAKSENTTLKVLLVEEKYEDLIKNSLINFKKSILNLYIISKKENNELNDSINKLLFLEDTSVLGVDKITSIMLEDILSKMGKQDNVGLNFVLDINNADKLRVYIEKFLNNMVYLKSVSNSMNIESKESSSNDNSNHINKEKESDSKNDLITQNILMMDNIDSILNILISFDSKDLQYYLKQLEFYKENNSFILYIYKFLEHLAKSENTLLINLISDDKYLELIKNSLTDFKKSINSLNILIQKDNAIINEEINKLFFVENPKTYGVDKITIEVIKELLSNSTNTGSSDLNNLLDYKNAEVLKKLLTKVVEGITTKTMFVTKKAKVTDSSNTRVDSIKQILNSSSNHDDILTNKIKKYIGFMIKDSGISYDEYVNSNEFNSFISINFENSNLIALIYSLLEKELDYSFNIDLKINDLFITKNNIDSETNNSINIIINKIINENNILFVLELLVNLKNETYKDVLKQVIINKEKIQFDRIYNYIDEYLKRPKQITMEEYIETNHNERAIMFFLLKLLIMLLLVILLSKKEEVL